MLFHYQKYRDIVKLVPREYYTICVLFWSQQNIGRPSTGHSVTAEVKEDIKALAGNPLKFMKSQFLHYEQSIIMKEFSIFGAHHKPNDPFVIR